MKSMLLAALAAVSISPVSHAQKLWRQTEYTVYDLNQPSPIPEDSTVYYYNPYNASLPTWDPVKGLIYDPYVEHFKCDSFVRYKHSWGYHPWYVDRVEKQSFDAKGNVTNRIIQVQKQSTKPVENAEGDQYTYDASGNLQTYLHLNWENNQWNDVFRENNSYAAGNLSGKLTDTFKAGQWVNNWKREYTYANGKLNEETLLRWTSGSWQSVSKLIYTYDIAGKLAEKASQEWSTINTGWENKVRNLYIYDANGNCLTDSTQYWQISSLTWQTGRFRVYQYDPNNNPTNLLERGLQNINPPPATKTWTNLRMHNYTYNANNLISRDERSLWEEWMSSWQPDAEWNYYYQQFTVGVPELAQTQTNLTLYPNPAITQLHINATWKNAQPFTVTILDMSGRVLKQWSEGANKTYSAAIPVMDMPAGNYTIRLNNGEERISQRFSVLK